MGKYPISDSIDQEHEHEIIYHIVSSGIVAIHLDLPLDFV